MSLAFDPEGYKTQQNFSRRDSELASTYEAVEVIGSRLKYDSFEFEGGYDGCIALDIGRRKLRS